MTLRMADRAGKGLYPPGFDVLAGYVNYVPGAHTVTWPTARNQAASRGVKALSITTNAGLPADVLDMESGAATYASAISWFTLSTAARWPIFYMGVRFVDQVVAELEIAGHPRASFRLWSAHYGEGVHICGPTTCGYCQAFCDGTQWAGTVGTSPTTYDESVLTAGFFGTKGKVADMKWGIALAPWTAPTGQVVPAAAWAIIPGPTGLRRAHVPHPADEQALRAMGATTVAFAPDTVAAMPVVAL